MRSNAKYIAVVFCLLLPALARAQNTGRVECPRQDNYIYLYSSMTTMEVRTTLQCGEQVQITGRYDSYFAVQTAKGDTGFVPLSSLVLLKDKPGPKAPQPKADPPARPRTAYDEPAPRVEVAPKPVPSPSELLLLNGTPIHLKLGKSISSATAHVGEVVELTVTEEVVVDGLSLIPSGATAVGIVSEAEPKKHMGHSGKLGLSINFVKLSDNEKAAVRSYQEAMGPDSSTGTVNPLASGKDVVFAQGMEFTAYVDGDIHLKREKFQAARDDANAAPAATAQNPPQPRQQ
jgi:hypothetical protein